MVCIIILDSSMLRLCSLGTCESLLFFSCCTSFQVCLGFIVQLICQVLSCNCLTGCRCYLLSVSSSLIGLDRGADRASSFGKCAAVLALLHRPAAARCRRNADRGEIGIQVGRGRTCGLFWATRGTNTTS